MKEDNEDAQVNPGTAKAPPIIKAGCGIRFDLDQLAEDTGFDFSGAAKLKKLLAQKAKKDDTPRD
ncbi:MAG: hypothetical protein CL583_03395 [Alteromonadaceae bacterium]|mgnify:CR=1 FL=1|nr:hypothetical protein [Alteromonadaceae bacterium]|tara:strand:+ start:3096 stop:3290 length:195 start_codon:yes stop_codon:yes gene_type:complete